MLLEGLNPQQREAITAGDGPVLVLAGPGSGKTRVLTHRIAYLIGERSIHPYHLMAVTFTNKAAAEMRARVEKLLGGRLDGLQLGTFHSICSRLLRREAEHTPYSSDYAIYDTDDQMSAIKQVLGELNVDTKKFNPGRVLNAISSCKNELISPETFTSRDYFGEVVGRAYGRYQKLLVQNNAMDFDDLLMQTAVLLHDNTEVREKYQNRLQYILVDEFQDTNTAQYRLVQLLGQPQNNVFVVGDEDQGIYAFRGADYRNVLQFRRDFPEAHVILLEQNYRSTQTVLDAARSVIDKNAHRTPKALFTDRKGGPLITIFEAYSESEEGEYIATKINEMCRRSGLDYKDFAVMYRTNAQSRALEESFVSAGVPYKLVGGVGFYKRREIRDLLAYMRVVNNPNDSISFNRIINVPGRGIGKKSLETFQDWIASQGITCFDGLQMMMRGEASPISGKAARSMADFGRMVMEWRALLEQNDLLGLFDAITGQTGYNLYMHEISEREEEIQDRLENIGEFRALVTKNRDLSLNDFLAETALVADIDTLDQTQDMVTLLTLHAAKGLEYPVVFIAGLEEGLLPHSRSFDDPDGMAEERRLLYVGLTRAMNQLYLTYAFRRTLYGDSAPSIVSRFLGDIPASLTEGVSPKVGSMRDRQAYQRATSWGDSSSTSSWKSTGKPSAPSAASSVTGKGKVIPFPGSQLDAPKLKYRTGIKVFHAKFGEGIVIESQVYGNDEEVTVAFEKLGIKKLAASFANLVILSE
jgi:DNA helicase II / ATP-dependent DNA helicase PcrA